MTRVSFDFIILKYPKKILKQIKKRHDSKTREERKPNKPFK